MEEELRQIIEQVTLRKLCYAQQLLQSANLPYTGTREQIRERLADAIEHRHIEAHLLQALLGELDAWGNQRVRLCRLAPEILAQYQTEETISRIAAASGMEELLGGEIPLVPPAELTPMSIRYEENGHRRLLRLHAAKTRHIRVPQPSIPEHFDDEHYPGVVFVPFKTEEQKAVSFAEIDLDTGATLLSTTLMRQGSRYHAEYEEFFGVFESFMPLCRAEPIPLFAASQAIRSLPHGEVCLFSQRTRTGPGGRLEGRSHSAKADMRTDPEMAAHFPPDSGAAGLHCNCFWDLADGLEERVHTHVYAPEGEVSFMGQVREASVRYVLSRILSLN